MTTLRVATLATTLLMLAPFTMASSTSLFDEAGDETARRINLSNDIVDVKVGDCKSPAADIQRIDVNNDGETLTLTMELASLANLDYECDAFLSFGSRADEGRWSISLTEPAGEEITTDNTMFLDAEARSTGLGIEGCMAIGFPDTTTDGCLGEFSHVGNAMKWSIPLTGSVTVLVLDDPSGVTAHEEDRTYSLSGRTADLSADAEVQDMGIIFFGGTGIVIEDFASAEGLTL